MVFQIPLIMLSNLGKFLKTDENFTIEKIKEDLILIEYTEFYFTVSKTCEWNGSKI